MVKVVTESESAADAGESENSLAKTGINGCTL
jgi:hypothetical protein